MTTTAAAFGLQHLLADTGAARPGHTALICGDTAVTYAELDRGANGAACALAAAGIGPGDRIAYLGKNSREYLELLLGCAQIGAVAVAVNWRLAPREVAEILADAGPRLLVLEDTFAELAGGTEIPLVVVGGRGTGGTVGTATRYEDWRQPADAGPEPYRVRPDDIALQIYTSGTTGRPKGVMLSHANLAATMPSCAEFWELQDDSTMLTVLPWFHIAGIGPVLGTLWKGASVVLLNDADPEVIVAHLARHRVTTVVLVSALLQRILESPSMPAADLSALRLLAYGASPISQTVLARAVSSLGCRLAQVYGLTENTGTVTVLPPEDHDLTRPTTVARLLSCGRPQDEVEVRLVDPITGLDAAVGEVGEIWSRSDRTMVGYWNNPAATADAITADGWLRSGDLATQDADGYVYLKDRLKDMIVSGGENIYPAEIENVLAGCPSVAEATVVGVPSAAWGESPRAIVVLRPGVAADDTTAAAILAYTRERLARYKCPEAVEFVSALPRNASGKVLKHVVREPFWHGLDRRVH
jgi:long-chain acyl-CoA synthetase